MDNVTQIPLPPSCDTDYPWWTHDEAEQPVWYRMQSLSLRMDAMNDHFREDGIARDAITRELRHENRELTVAIKQLQKWCSWLFLGMNLAFGLWIFM